MNNNYYQLQFSKCIQCVHRNNNNNNNNNKYYMYYDGGFFFLIDVYLLFTRMSENGAPIPT